MTDGPENPNPFRLAEGDAFGFEADGERVPVAWPEIYDELDASGEPRVDLQAVLGRFLANLASLGKAQKIGQTVLVLAYLAGQAPFKTKAELARQLKVSPSRVSQILAAIPSDFESLSRLKSRTAKARPICRENL